MARDPKRFMATIDGWDAVTLARALVGAMLVVRGAGGVVIETEAYGRDDPASHSFRGETARNRAMFGPAGHAYVYRSYGIHLCLNVVARRGEAVLIRAIDPLVGVEVMAERRGAGPLCSGPGRLAQALGVTLADDGAAFDGGDFAITLPEGAVPLVAGPRVGISKAVEVPWRFGLRGAAGVSRRFQG